MNFNYHHYQNMLRKILILLSKSWKIYIMMDFNNHHYQNIFKKILILHNKSWQIHKITNIKYKISINQKKLSLVDTKL